MRSTFKGMNLVLIGFAVLMLIGAFFVSAAFACNFVGEESIENSGSEYYYNMYDSSNWTMPENIYHPDNYDQCLMLGWC